MRSEILIKGMVCERCISVIRECITNLGFQVAKVTLGKVTLTSEIPAAAYESVAIFLQRSGFQLISGKDERVVSQVKRLVDEAFDRGVRQDGRLKFSAFLADNLHMSYDTVSQLFSQSEGMTLERYIIMRRLEKVKELLVYSSMTLTQIASNTGFSNISHLSRQFKELTGLTPNHFRSIRVAKNELSGDSASS